MDGEIFRHGPSQSQLDEAPPSRRRFTPREVSALLPNLAVASIARCPGDDTRLVATIEPHVISLVCPRCGAWAEWRSPV